jgi:hypothetical protein
MNEQVTLWTRLYTFGDERFMTADEKWRVLNAWKRFIRNGFQYAHFTEALYRHLHLHCAFSAKNNRYGFWIFYCASELQDFYRFLDQFGGSRQSAELGARWWLDGPTGADLNQAMCSEMEIVFEALTSALDRHAPRVTEAQRRRLAAAARGAFQAHAERLASFRQVALSPSRVGVQLSLWDMLDAPRAAADATMGLEVVGIGEAP